MTGIIEIHFRHYIGKYGLWYWIHTYLLCGDRPTAARCCACFFSGFVVRGIVTCSHTVVYLEFWHVLMTGSVLFMCGLSDRFKSFLMISCLCIEWKLYLFGDLLDWSNVWAVSKAINHADSLDFLGSRALILFLYFFQNSLFQLCKISRFSLDMYFS